MVLGLAGITKPPLTLTSPIRHFSKPTPTPVSEYRLEGYFVSTPELTAAFNSGDVDLLDKVREDENELLSDMNSRTEGDVSEHLQDLIIGTPSSDPAYQAAYSFGVWAITEAVAETQPRDPIIGYPFLDLYEVCETLRTTPYTRLTQFFEAINGERPHAFPYQLPGGWYDLPGIGYIDAEEINKYAGEATRMRADFNRDEEWTLDIEEPEDIVQVLDWIEEAKQLKMSLAVFMDGDL